MIILSQIQRETKAFLLIVRHNAEGPPISDSRAANEIFHINPDQLFKKTQIAMKNPSFQKYNM